MCCLPTGCTKGVPDEARLQDRYGEWPLQRCNERLDFWSTASHVYGTSSDTSCSILALVLVYAEASCVTPSDARPQPQSKFLLFILDHV